MPPSQIRPFRIAWICLFALAVQAPQAQVKTIEGFAALPLVTGLQYPTALAFALDGRLFVTEKAGRVRIVKDGTLLATSFATVTAKIQGTEAGAESGLLGIALDPSFAVNGNVYVFYSTGTPQDHNRIARFKASGDVADPVEGEAGLFDYPRSGLYNHNGGGLHFGSDSMLYASHGEVAWPENAVDMKSLFGKIIRIKPVADSNAQIPSDNPLLARTSGKARAIYAFGLRNPFSFAFEPVTGRLFINDVGQGAYEEINIAAAGGDFGWPATEGAFDRITHPGYVHPHLAYSREGNAGSRLEKTVGSCIVGGAFAPIKAEGSSAFPAELRGKYFFGDFGFDSWIRYLDPKIPDISYPFAQNTSASAMTFGPDGAFYYTDHAQGKVMRIAILGSPIRDLRFDSRVKQVQTESGRHRLVLPGLRGIRTLKNARFSLGLWPELPLVSPLGRTTIAPE